MNDLDLNDFQRLVGLWGTETFPRATNVSIIAHLRAEVGELSGAQNEPLIDSGGPWIGEEAADCLLLLLHIAHRNGFSLFDAAVAKHAVNRTRTWETKAGDKGYRKHTEAVTP